MRQDLFKSNPVSRINFQTPTIVENVNKVENKLLNIIIIESFFQHSRLIWLSIVVRATEKTFYFLTLTINCPQHHKQKFFFQSHVKKKN